MICSFAYEGSGHRNRKKLNGMEIEAKIKKKNIKKSKKKNNKTTRKNERLVFRYSLHWFVDGKNAYFVNRSHEFIRLSANVDFSH